MPSSDDGSFVSTIDSDVERENIDEIVALPASARVMHLARKKQEEDQYALERVENFVLHTPAGSVPHERPKAEPEIRSSAAPGSIPDVSGTERGVCRRDFGNLAEHMVESQGHEAVVFRRFDDVNLKLLMGFERRITELRGRLQVAEETSLKGENEGEIECLERQLEKEMDRYYEKMLLTKRILALEGPRKRALENTRLRFRSEDVHDSSVLDKYYKPQIEDDLVCLGSPSNTNWIVRWMEKSMDKTIPRQISAFLSAMCAVGFLVGAMIGLYFVSNGRVRLGMIAVFTVLFAITIATLTNTRKQDIFVATAAYAAVLVVFVSGNIAANAEPTICILSGAGGNAGPSAGAEALNFTDNTGSQAMTVTATAIQTVTASPTGSIQSIFTTVMETVTVTPTVIPEKKQLDDVSKAGVGIGIAIGALLVVILVIGMAAWLRKRVRLRESGIFGTSALGNLKARLNKGRDVDNAHTKESVHTGRRRGAGHIGGKEKVRVGDGETVVRETWV